MRVGLHLGAIAALGGMIVMAGPAAADPAPITYAAQPVRTASLTASLAGGDERSYGYDRQQPSNTPALDVRRSARQGVAAEQGRPEWLERERVGPPYEINGRWYAPAAEPGYEMQGTASWYGPTFHGRQTASGEIFDQEAMTAAHPTLPIPSLVQVTNLENGREIIVRVNDRGPFIGDRLIDLSRRSAEVLGFEQQGSARVHVRYLGPAPRHVAAGNATPSAPQPAAASRAPTQIAAAAPMPRQDGPVSLLPPSSTVTAEAPVIGAPMIVETAYTPPPAPAPSYSAPVAAEGLFVQVGAFADLMNAHRVKDAIASAGPVQVDARETANGELFRVRIGPLADRAAADAVRAHLADLGYAQTIVASR